MTEIHCNDEAYIYNVYHIVKAFFPAEEIIQSIENGTETAVRVCLPDRTSLCIDDRAFMGNGNMDRKQMKDLVDRQVYRFCSQNTGKELPWGLLTGVRPTKIAMKKLEEGMGKKEFIHWFREHSLVCEEKAGLAYEIAGREKALLDRLDYEQGFSLYAGIPFCPTVCTYCSFSSGPLSAWQHRVEEYLDALCKELRFIGSVSGHKRLNTVYLGGGTPTTLTADQLNRLLTCIDQSFHREHVLEYTVEAGRPDSITAEKLKALYDHGVTRISINPQSMQQKTLDLIGRRHSVREVVDTYHMARDIGFDNINMDLIAGLPGEDAEDMRSTLGQIEQLSPDSLTVHALAIKRAALMGQERAIKGYAEALDRQRECLPDILSEMIRQASESAGRMNLKPYYLYRQKNIAGNFENVGYAKVDKAGIYNILIMEEKQSIVAAGAGASTKIVLKEAEVLPGSRTDKKTNLVRIENVKAIDAYIARIGEMIERKGEWLWR